MQSQSFDARPIVSEYYGKTLKSSEDLLTSACCPVDAVPAAHRTILAQLHPDVTSRFYGCGSPIPDYLSGATILDLGCGTGRDAFLAAALAGRSGRVIGIDMTDEQLAVAREHAVYHAHRFFGEDASPNTDFRKGYIEDLKAAGIGDGQIDVVISNCVCNLSTNKRQVFAEISRVLREGGELYFSDVYADRRLSDEARQDPTLVAECLGGALYIEDFRRIMSDVGLHDLRVMSSGPIEVRDARLKELVPDVNFSSITFRVFKVRGLEDRRENYGQLATYTSCGSGMKLDADYEFRKGMALPVDGNTAMILQQARFNGKFNVTPRGPHRGLFSKEIEGGALAAMLGSANMNVSRSCGQTNGSESQSSGWTAKHDTTENGGCGPGVQVEPEMRSCGPVSSKLKSGGGCC